MPGTHPMHVRMVTSRMVLHPLSITARGGKMIAVITLKQLIVHRFSGERCYPLPKLIIRLICNVTGIQGRWL